MSTQQQRAAVFHINLRLRVAVVFAGVFVMNLLAPAMQAQTFETLHTFTSHGDGSVPEAGVTMDRTGNFYGTTL